jgi:DNA-binding CsgD family transcriptional regulator/PAS domain-containing protein
VQTSTSLCTILNELIGQNLNPPGDRAIPMTALSSQHLSEVIGRIYDCSLDPGRWEPTLDALRLLLVSNTVQFGLIDTRGHRRLISTTLGMEPELQQCLPEICEQAERLLDHGHSMDEPIIFNRDWSPAYRNSARHLEQVCREQGIVDFAQINVLRSPARAAALGFGRHASVGTFGDEEIDFVRLLIPHVRRAVTISNLVDAKTIEAARIGEALDALKIGVILADPQAAIVHANRAAEAMLRADGPLGAANGVLRAERPVATAELRCAVSAAARNEAGLGKTGLAVRLSDDYETPVVAHVLPLSAGEIRTRLEPAAVAAVFISTPLDEVSCARTLASAYKLTPAETRVLREILSGKSVVEAAADLGVAMTTARTHLDNIFAKTGVSRQSELIKLGTAVAPPALEERP